MSIELNVENYGIYSSDGNLGINLFCLYDGTELVLPGAGARVTGVCKGDGNVDGQETPIQVRGIAKCVAAGALSANVVVAVTAAGKVTTAGSTDFPVGVTVEASTADGDVIAVDLNLSLVPLV